VNSISRSGLFLLLAFASQFSSPAIANGPIKAGDAFEILRSYETQSKENGDDSSSSSGHTTIVERVLSVEENGLELQYEQPPEEDGRRRSGNWQLPARIYRPIVGQPKLLNTEELEARLGPWLEEAKFPREACGQYIFTWTAFKIECDPASALGIIENYNLWVADLSDGKLYGDEYALEPLPLKLKFKDDSKAVYEVGLTINPDKVRQGDAETDVVVSKIMGKPKSLEEASRDQVGKKISGTMLIEIEADPSGFVRKKATVTKVQVEEPDGKIESRLATVIVERKPYPEPGKSSAQ
jgi:hypothetical protein